MIVLTQPVLVTDQTVEAPLGGPSPEGGQAFSDAYVAAEQDALDESNPVPPPGAIATVQMIETPPGLPRGGAQASGEAEAGGSVEAPVSGRERADDAEQPHSATDVMERPDGFALAAMPDHAPTGGGLAASAAPASWAVPPQIPPPTIDAAPAVDAPPPPGHDRLAPAWWPQLPGQGAAHRPQDRGPDVPALDLEEEHMHAAAGPQSSPPAEGAPPDRPRPAGPRRAGLEGPAARPDVPRPSGPAGDPAENQPLAYNVGRQAAGDMPQPARAGAPVAPVPVTSPLTHPGPSRRADADRTHATDRPPAVQPVGRAGPPETPPVQDTPGRASLPERTDAPILQATADPLTDGSRADIPMPVAESARAPQPGAPQASLPHAPGHSALPAHAQLLRAAENLRDGPIELALSPEELGRVRMTLVASDQGLSLNLVAERPETVELLRRNIGELAQDFRDLGFRNLAFSFAQGDGSQGRNRQAADQHPPAFESAALAPPPADIPAPRRQASLGDGLDLRF